MAPGTRASKRKEPEQSLQVETRSKARARLEAEQSGVKSHRTAGKSAQGRREPATAGQGQAKRPRTRRDRTAEVVTKAEEQPIEQPAEAAGPSDPEATGRGLPKPESEEGRPMEQNRREGASNTAGGGARPEQSLEEELVSIYVSKADKERELGGSAHASALQGMLRKLGTGFDDIMPGGCLSSSRWKGILSQLRQDDEVLQLDALGQLCELLSISMEDSLSIFPVEQSVPILVQLLQTDHNPDIMILAARALTFLADVLPSSCTSIVRHGAVPIFCERLLNIEYIDLAEQSLQALQKLAMEHPQACMRHGALLAVLSYLDFFQTGVQRVAVATAAHMCRGLSSDSHEAIAGAVPLLTNLLHHQDAKVVENACLALSRIAEASSHAPVQLEALCNAGLIASAVQLVAVSETGSMTSQLSVSTYYGLIKLLTTCAAGSPTVTESLHTAGISGTISRLLSRFSYDSSTLLSSSTSSPASVLRSSDQLYEVVSLTCKLLPAIPDTSILILEDLPVSADLLGKEEDKEGLLLGGSADVGVRRKFLKNHPEVLERFCSDLLPLVVQVYSSTVITQYASPELLAALLQDVPISSFVAGLLGARDGATLAAGVRLAELLMAKLPGIFETIFVKEGVVHGMEELAATAPKPVQQPASAPAVVSVPAPSSKPRFPKRSSTRLKGKDKERAKEREQERAKEEAKWQEALPEYPLPAPLVKPAMLSLKEATAVRAQRFVSTHFGASRRQRSLEMEGLRNLKAVCARLGTPGATAELFTLLQDGASANVSTFEFLSSGAVDQLRAFLLGEDLSAPNQQAQLLKRLSAFKDAMAASGPSGAAGFVGLLHKLQDGLASTESFPVVGSQLQAPMQTTSRFSSVFLGSRSVPDSSSLSSGLAALTQPFKLRLARAPHEQELGDYASNVVLIEPLATMAAVEEFLWPRVHRAGRARGDSPRDAGEAGIAGAVPSSKPEPSAAPTAGEAKEKDSEAGAKARRAMAAPKPIPSPRVTRAQALRAAVLAQEANGSSPDGSSDAHLASTAPTSTAPNSLTDEDGRTEGDVLEEEEHLILLQEGAETAARQGEGGDEDMEDDDGYDEEEDMDGADMEDEDHMDLGPQVHNLQLGDGLASPAPEAEPPGAPRVAAPQSYAQVAASAVRHSEAGGSNGAQRPAGQPRLRFSFNGNALAANQTIFQAVQSHQRSAQAAEGTAGDAEVSPALRKRRLWDEIHTLHYSRFENLAPQTEAAASRLQDGADASTSSGAMGDLETSPLAELLTLTVPQGLGASEQTGAILVLLKALEALNRLGGHLGVYQESLLGKRERRESHFVPVPREEFCSSKLAPKLAQQLKDVLAICGGNLPTWTQLLIEECKFLFPFDLRRRYFYCTAFGLARALHHLQQQQVAEGAAAPHTDSREYRVGRIQRSKVRISRKRILESAAKVMELYAHSRAVLELEYFNEAGTGLGPTLEFYTLLSHELQRRGLAMWRSDESAATGIGFLEDSKPGEAEVIREQPSSLPMQADAAENAKPQAYVSAPQGLFPAPLAKADVNGAVGAKVVERFRLLGRAIAKALQDNRMLDIPLSYIFYRVALRRPVDLFDIRRFDAALGGSLETLNAAHLAWKAAGRPLQPMLVDGTPIEELCLSFELPGHPQYELRPGGSEMTVDASNVAEYIAAVVDATLHKGISAQLAAFREGFNEVFPLESLGCFFEDEVEAMLCGTGESWTADMLADTIKFDHGYTAGSTVVRWLLETLTELDAADQRRFLRFVTGSPRLPPGGLAALHPRLTVVRKHPSSSGSREAASLSPSSASAGSASGSLRHQASTSLLADGDLPSVMTCANYIKLPAYSSKQVLQARLLYAIREGQGSFDLS